MSILIDKNTRLLVQGITGNEGIFHTTQMVAYGTNVVAGVTPGKGGEWVLEGKVPVFDSVKLAKDATDANCAVIFVPARFSPDAMFEAADAGIPLIVCITEGVAVQDMMRVRNYLDQKKVRLIGRGDPFFQFLRIFLNIKRPKKVLGVAKELGPQGLLFSL